MKSLPGKFKISGSQLSFQNSRNLFQPVALHPISFQEKNIQLVRGKDSVFWRVHELSQAKGKTYHQSLLSVSAETLYVNDIRVPAKALFFPKPGGKDVDLIGVIDLESYLVGVLASEVPASWPMEALKAQAVATRSYTLFQMKQKSNQPYHLQSTVLDQVFDYSKLKSLPRFLQIKIQRAVRETAGQVLLDSKGNSLQAYYHSSCGGHGEEPHHIWKNDVYFHAKKDRFCKGAPNSGWKYQISGIEMAQKAGLSGEVILLKKLGRNKSGRIIGLEIKTEGGQKKILSGQEFRKLIGFSNIKSTRFIVNTEGKEFTFQGKGYGHGAGLCQWGARGAALKKLSYRQILEHYYPNAYLQNSRTERLSSL